MWTVLRQKYMLTVKRCNCTMSVKSIHLTCKFGGVTLIASVLSSVSQRSTQNICQVNGQATIIISLMFVVKKIGQKKFLALKIWNRNTNAMINVSVKEF